MEWGRYTSQSIFVNNSLPFWKYIYIYIAGEDSCVQCHNLALTSVGISHEHFKYIVNVQVNQLCPNLHASTELLISFPRSYFLPVHFGRIYNRIYSSGPTST